MVPDTPRWKKLRLRAYASGIQHKEIAHRIDYHPESVSRILRGDEPTESGLNNIERAINEIEQERKYDPAA